MNIENKKNELEEIITTEFYWNYIVNITVTKEATFNRVEFFFNNKVGILIWYIKLHLINSEYERDIARIIDVTSASWYAYFSWIMKEKYDNNWYNDWVFIKWKGSEFLSYVIRYIDRNYPNKKIILVSCLEKNIDYLRPLIKNVKDSVSDLITEIWWGSEVSSFTIFLK